MSCSFLWQNFLFKHKYFTHVSFLFKWNVRDLVTAGKVALFVYEIVSLLVDFRIQGWD